MESRESPSAVLTEFYTLPQLTNSSLIENGAHIIYMFNESTKYISNAIHFITEGLTKGHLIILIESEEFFNEINKQLIQQGYSEQDLKTITYIDQMRQYSNNKQFEADHSFQSLLKLLKPTIDPYRTTRLWGQVLAKDALLSELRKYECDCDEFMGGENVISVCAYNALFTPSYIQNEMLKVHGYFMTDEQIEKSPFYNKKNLLAMSPSEKARLQNIENENQRLKKKNSRLLKEKAYQQEREQILYEAKRHAENANAMKTTFLSQMSHDLRTPLNIIQGYAQILMLEGSHQRLQKNIQKIFGASNDLLKLIEEILDFSAIEAGKVTINKEPIHLKTFIDNSVSAIFDFNHSDIMIKVDHIDDNLYIEADRLRLTQVITNLLTNAIKYNQPHGEISVFIDFDELREEIKIHVKDTGIGISDSELHLIFDPFYRSETSKSKWKGTGIGLAIVSQLTNKMNGSYGVTSEEGNGSNFWVSFKGFASTQPCLVALQPSATHQHPSTDDLNVLYIEDNQDNIDLMSSMLHIITDIQLTSEMTGKDGYHKAIEMQPDLILLDLHLPDTNGLNVLNDLKTHALTKHIPVIAISAEALESSIDLALEQGCQGYLTKPVNLTELRDVVMHYSNN
ncbi:ATP-binding protein [Halalkalibacter alkalisediminis]|uniref:histidine kinase n=1 Tax=Halalkalibacter alkalisediminis TaxID=935616 RepID=A0ABV6NIQ6_9BACI|nr:ATP-binding protein [Halalkalibacter alkalisediminis]